MGIFTPDLVFPKDKKSLITLALVWCAIPITMTIFCLLDLIYPGTLFNKIENDSLAKIAFILLELIGIIGCIGMIALVFADVKTRNWFFSKRA